MRLIKTLPSPFPLTALILALTCPFFSPRSVLAQQAGLAISPPVVEILLAPNKKIIQTFTVTNQGETGQFTVSFHMVKPNGEEGQVIVDPATLDPSSIPLVVTLGNRDLSLNEPFTITAGSAQSITVHIEGANTDVSQDTYFAMLVQPYLENSFSQTSSAIPGIASLVLTTLTPSGTLPLNLGIENFDLPLIHDSLTPLPLSPSLKNNSPTMVRPEGKLEILSPRDRHNSEIKLFPNLVLAGSSRILSAAGSSSPPAPTPLVYRPSWRNFGPYRLRLTITTLGGTKLQEVERTVWLLPLRAILFLTLLSIGIATLIVRQRQSSIRSKGEGPKL